ncbi:GGDEF domain-containing protein [Quadrisphaera setariae]|uniref:GGDEF domain-containing protein n=2 Tax=Quadrisphaera setariae TaxID=2593304 RepID=A0A5C8ZEH7_9ACTN|nr:GGDEF domain-containing protein [Quadrisphaera setariae]
MMWVWVLVLGAVGSVAYTALTGPFDAPVAAAVVYTALGALGLLGTAWGASRLPRRAALPWWCVTAVQLVWSAVDVRYLVLTTQGAYTGAPAAADAPYLLGYPPLLLAVLLLLRRARAARPRGAFADAAVLGTGVALLGWAVLVGPVLHSTPDDPRARVGAVLFLACDVVLTGLVVVLLASSSRASTSTWLALAAALAGLVGDSTYLVEGVVPSGVLTALSVGWTSGGALWAAAACHPSAGRAPERSNGEDFGRPRIVALVGGVALAPAVLVLDLVVGGGSSSVPAVVAASAMTLLVVGRLAVALSAAGASLAEREVMRRALEHQARHDGLTGLPNRSATVARIAAALDAAQHHGTQAGLLFVDLDGFKAVNDSRGHRAGDEVLRVVAARLAGCLRPGDVVGRLGGDEFVVVLDRLAGGEDAEDAVEALLAAGQRIVDVVAQPITVDGELFSVGASVGAALGGGAEQPTTPDALLHEADTAAYRAKASGRGRVELAETCSSGRQG